MSPSHDAVADIPSSRIPAGSRNSSEATASAVVAGIAETLATALQHVREEVETLSQAIDGASEQASNEDCRNPSSLPGGKAADRPYPHIYQEDWRSRLEHNHKLLEESNDFASLEKCKKTFKYDHRSMSAPLREGTVFWVKLRPGPNTVCEDLALPPDPLDDLHRSWIDRICARIEERWSPPRAGVAARRDLIQYYPERSDHGVLGIPEDSGPQAPGKICSILGRRGVGPHQGRYNTMDIETLVALAKGFFNYRMGNELWGEERYFRDFIYSFCDLYNPSATRSISHISTDRVVVLQYHLSHFALVDWLETGPSAPRFEGLALKRQVAKIRRVTHMSSNGGKNPSRDEEQTERHFKERILSVSLTMSMGDGGAFKLILVGDYGMEEVTPTLESKAFHPGFNTLGIERKTWKKGWDNTLDTIDIDTSFDMDHTFDADRLNGYMFDDSSSMHMSTRYFSTLQLLRIARQRIVANLAEWERFCDTANSDKGWIARDIKMREDVGDQVLERWETERKKMTRLLETMTVQLRDRIDRKIEEVKSLQDGLFNATSVREAIKAMTINRAIYVFTAVTVIYTPLGFVAAFWALPILNTTSEGESTRPSSVAFVATFVIVPALTYIGCILMAWYFTSTRSWNAFIQTIQNLPQKLRWWAQIDNQWLHELAEKFRANGRTDDRGAA
ncbi:hypothetical protein INS49_008380 [Diaporthe citri]|uniref:uncharacterized protein n=1 Tax=Diaporthe citri TaxID=83186 RepID=UPI001C7E44FB|nr:uncharacterized protein INS49_008380 [Diaporthe citri]KAG6363283.1 hypothetical protein INS49_008380 [Diaporthe citri]